MNNFEISIRDLIDFEDGKHFNEDKIRAGKYKFIRDLEDQSLDIPVHLTDVYNIAETIHFHYFDRELYDNDNFCVGLTSFGRQQNCTQIDPFLYEKDIEWIQFLFSRYGEKYAIASRPLIEAKMKQAKNYLNHINSTFDTCHEYDENAYNYIFSKQYYEKEINKCNHKISIYSEILSSIAQSSNQEDEMTTV